MLMLSPFQTMAVVLAIALLCGLLFFKTRNDTKPHQDAIIDKSPAQENPHTP